MLAQPSIASARNALASRGLLGQPMPPEVAGGGGQRFLGPPAHQGGGPNFLGLPAQGGVNHSLIPIDAQHLPGWNVKYQSGGAEDLIARWLRARGWMQPGWSLFG